MTAKLKKKESPSKVSLVTPKVSVNKAAAPTGLNTPIDVEPATWPILDDKAYPGWIGEFVSMACEKSEADPVAVLITLLLRFAAEIQGAYLHIGDAKHFGRTNAVIVGNSSKARKGTSYKPVKRLFGGLKNVARTSPGPLSSGQGLIFQVRDEQLKFDKKSEGYIRIDPGIPDKRLFVLDEEFEVALNSIKAPNNTLSATIRYLYDDGNVEPLTKTSKIGTTGAHIVIVAHITSEELASALSKVQMSNGFGNRFLWILARRQKLVAMPEAMPDKAIRRFQKILAANIAAVSGHQQITMNEKAGRLWTEIYPELTMDYSGAAGALVNRSETHAIRLAMIYALMLGHKQIKAADLEAALALIKYSRESTSIIFKRCPTDGRKEKIIRALINADRNRMTLTDININVFRRNVSSEEIQVMLTELQTSKLIKLRKKKTEGRTKTFVSLAPVGNPG